MRTLLAISLCLGALSAPAANASCEDMTGRALAQLEDVLAVTPDTAQHQAARDILHGLCVHRPKDRVYTTRGLNPKPTKEERETSVSALVYGHGCECLNGYTEYPPGYPPHDPVRDPDAKVPPRSPPDWGQGDDQR